MAIFGNFQENTAGCSE